MTTELLDREDFLDSHRALAVCAREFDRLAEDISKRIVNLEDEAKGLKADVRRSPGRCIVQLGPVALTISWLRTRAETVSQGRLLIVEWNGTVGANGAQEYVNGVPTVAVTQTAKVVRETVFVATRTTRRAGRGGARERRVGKRTGPPTSPKSALRPSTVRCGRAPPGVPSFAAARVDLRAADLLLILGSFGLTSVLQRGLRESRGPNFF
jgi:hypothetical protein